MTWCRVVQFSADYWCNLVEIGGTCGRLVNFRALLCFALFSRLNHSTSDFFKNSVLFPFKYPSSLYERFRHGSVAERFTSRTSYIEISA